MAHIDYLKNQRHTIPMWADYFYDEWKIYYLRSHRTRADVEQGMEERCNTDRLPLAAVALEAGVAVGTGRTC